MNQSCCYLGNHSSRALRVSSGFLVGFLSQPSLLEIRCTCVSTPKKKYQHYKLAHESTNWHFTVNEDVDLRFLEDTQTLSVSEQSNKVHGFWNLLQIELKLLQNELATILICARKRNENLILHAWSLQFTFQLSDYIFHLICKWLCPHQCQTPGPRRCP